MSYNPYEVEFHRLCADVERLRKQKQQCADALSAHHAVDGTKLEVRVQTLTRQVEEANERHVRAEDSYWVYYGQAKKADARVGSAWNPVNWFSKEQEQAQRSAKAAWELVGPHIAELERAKKIVAAAENGLKDSKAELRRYRSFDVARLTAELEFACSALPIAEAQLEALEPRWEEACSRLAPLEEDLARAKAEERGLLEEIERAEKFDEMLGRTRNGWEKREVHQACESALGDGSPKRVANRAKRRLAGVQANIEKRRERLQEIATQIQRPVARVVIDGNNLCYMMVTGKSTFIGFRALAPLVRALCERVKVHVVFDGGICGQMKMGRQQVRLALDPRAEVNIMEGKADDMVLALAEDPDVYVISGDHFAEYPDRAPVRDNRLFEPLVASDRVVLLALDINVRLDEAGQRRDRVNDQTAVRPLS